MSDSSLSGIDTPTDATLEQALRNAVQKVYKTGNTDDLTVRRIRKAVEEDLDLQDGFFKNDSIWNTKSKTVIQSEVDAHPEPFTSSQKAPSSKPSPKKSHPPPPPKSRDQSRKAPSSKRASTDKVGPKKRRKKDTSDNEESGSDMKEAKSKRPPTKIRKRSVTSSVSPPPKEEEVVTSGLNGASKANSAGEGHSESEMSELIDEEPKPKRGGRKSGSAKPKTRKTEGSKPKRTSRTSEQPTDPDAEEIKKLQGWLVKCGIRKLWGKELAPYDKPKAKIRHLREMLAEAGMTGRYSTEKASQIKEERELRADLEAVQEGNKHWGKPESEEDGSTGRPRRRLARGLEGLDFLNDDDGEETD